MCSAIDGVPCQLISTIAGGSCQKAHSAATYGYNCTSRRVVMGRESRALLAISPTLLGLSDICTILVPTSHSGVKDGRPCELTEPKICLGVG